MDEWTHPPSRADNMSLSAAPIIQININNFQANTVLNSGHGGRIIQRNGIHHRIPIANRRSKAPLLAPHSSGPTERRVEAQPQIHRKLGEVSGQPKYASSRIGGIALLATRILSVVEQGNVAFSTQFVDLAMDAHAIAYIVVVSFLYQRLRMSKRSAGKLIELLDRIHRLLAETATTGNIILLLKKLATRNRRKSRAICMREELLNLLRKIERNSNADLLSTLDDAINHHHQHDDVDASE